VNAFEYIEQLSAHGPRDFSFRIIGKRPCSGLPFRRTILLAPRLAPGQKSEALTEALAVAKVIGNEGDRAQALESLAPHISPIQYAALTASLVEVAARCRREYGWNLFGGISSTMKLSDQAATSTS
jgi:hypothetical protein